MTREEVSDLLEVVDKLWAHSNVVSGDIELTINVWHMVLAQVPAKAAQEALMTMARSGREHAPDPGVLFAKAHRSQVAEPPSFEEAQDFLARHASCLPYGQSNTPEDTVRAVEALAEAGAHEVILRFVQAQGVYAIRMMPDPSLQPLDVGQQADRRDKARDYRSRTLEDWRADPTPGLALTRARQRVLEPGVTQLRQRIAGQLDEPFVDEARTARRAIVAEGDAEGDAD